MQMAPAPKFKFSIPVLPSLLHSRSNFIAVGTWRAGGGKESRMGHLEKRLEEYNLMGPKRITLNKQWHENRIYGVRASGLQTHLTHFSPLTSTNQF